MIGCAAWVWERMITWLSRSPLKNSPREWKRWDAAALARQAGFVDVAIHPDLTGRDRALVARRDAA